METINCDICGKVISQTAMTIEQALEDRNRSVDPSVFHAFANPRAHGWKPFFSIGITLRRKTCEDVTLEICSEDCLVEAGNRIRRELEAETLNLESSTQDAYILEEPL